MQVMKMIFACDTCHYLFSQTARPKQCPDCGKYTVRPASEAEKQEFEARMSEPSEL